MPRSWIAVAGAAAVMAAAVGCGSSGGGAASPSGGSSTTPKEEIRIGAVGSYSGAFASSLNGSRQTLEAWAAWVNASGGINGHPVKLIVEDDKGVVATSVTLMKKLVEEDRVVAVVGQVASGGGDAAWAPYLAEKGIPNIGGNSVDTQYLSDPNFFSSGANIVALRYGGLKVASAAGPKFAQLYCAELPTCQASITILNGIASSVGVSIAYSSKVAATAPDFTAQCQGLKDSGVNSYGMGLSVAVLKRVKAQCGSQGFNAPLITVGTGDESFAKDPSFEGTVYVDPNFPYINNSVPATKEFHDALAKYAPTVGTDAVPFNMQVTSAWSSGKLFEAAVKAIGDKPVTADSIKEGLYSLKDETLGGLVAPLNFTKGKVSLQNCYFTYKIEGGKLVDPNSMKPQCADAAAVNDIIAKFFTKK